MVVTIVSTISGEKWVKEITDKNESCRNFAAQYAPIEGDWMVTDDKANPIDDNPISKYDGQKIQIALGKPVA